MKIKTNLPSSQQTSRRQFTKAVAAGFIAAPLAASLAKGQTSAKPPEPTAPPNPQQQTPQKPSPEALAYAEVARQRFGEKWTPEQLEQVRKDLDNNLRAAERLRGVKLQNGDEPDFTFSA